MSLGSVRLQNWRDCCAAQPSTAKLREIFRLETERSISNDWVPYRGHFLQLQPQDPGIRGGFQNTAGMLQYRGIKIAPPPVISPHPVTGATITANELASFKEGILRAGQLEATCNECAMVIEGSPVPGELDPTFPQFTTNSNGLGARSLSEVRRVM